MPEKEEKKRTRVVPSYKEMFEKAQLELTALKAEVSYLAGRIDTEMDYSRTLSVLLRKKKGGA